jgi:hypothetical protein
VLSILHLCVGSDLTCQISHQGHLQWPVIQSYPVLIDSQYLANKAKKVPLVPLGFQPDALPMPEAKPTRVTGPGTPFGLAFFSTAWTEEKLLGYAYAYEQATKIRLQRKAYNEAIPRTQLQDVM